MEDIQTREALPELSEFGEIFARTVKAEREAKIAEFEAWQDSLRPGKPRKYRTCTECGVKRITASHVCDNSPYETKRGVCGKCFIELPLVGGCGECDD